MLGGRSVEMNRMEMVPIFHRIYKKSSYRVSGARQESTGD